MNSVLVHTNKSFNDRQRQLLIALTPVVLCSTWLFGYEVLINVLLCGIFGIGLEALARLLRGLPGREFHRDQDTLIIAVLLGTCLPPLVPWWQLLLGMAMAVLLIKHAYGGMGQHPFHPAMAALLFLCLSFPESAQNWPTPLASNAPGNPEFQFSGEYSAWHWLNLVALLCGMYLLFKRVIAWQIPAGLLVSLGLMPWLIATPDATAASLTNASLIQLFSGQTMLAAFFIATQPSSSASTSTGRLLYAAVIGAALFFIRESGELIDGIAAATILGNFLAPAIDQLFGSVRYGHGRNLLTTNTTEPE